MTSQTLHDSLHRGKANNHQGRDRSISFANVDIREYERVLGDNPSVRAGPPLSLGWRYDPHPLSMTIGDYERGKGAPRSSAEYLVPKAVREDILKDHARVSNREMVEAVRTIKKEKAQRRKTVVNLGMQKAEEKVEKVKRTMKCILKPSSSYKNAEAALWDDAHAVAMEKAQRLEQSIHKGESVTYKDLYSAGTPTGNILPSRRNSMPQHLENENIINEQNDNNRDTTLVDPHSLGLDPASNWTAEKTENRRIQLPNAGELQPGILNKSTDIAGELQPGIPNKSTDISTGKKDARIPDTTPMGQRDLRLESVAKLAIPMNLTPKKNQLPRRSSSGGLQSDTLDIGTGNKDSREPVSQRRFSHRPSIVASEDDDEDIFSKLCLADESNH